VQALDEMQKNLLERARAFQKQNTTTIHSAKDFYEYFNGEGGFALAHWNGDPALEAKIKQELSVTIRCLPFDLRGQTGQCIFTGEKSAQPVIFAKAY